MRSAISDWVEARRCAADVVADVVEPPGAAGGRSTAAGSPIEWLDDESHDESAQSRESAKSREARKAVADFD